MIARRIHTLKLPAKAEDVCCPAMHRWAAERLYRHKTGRGGCGLVAETAGSMSIQHPTVERREGSTDTRPEKGERRLCNLPLASVAWYRRGTGGPGRKGAAAVDLCRSGPLGTGGRRSCLGFVQVPGHSSTATAQGPANHQRRTCRVNPLEVQEPGGSWRLFRPFLAVQKGPRAAARNLLFLERRQKQKELP